ncbi:MAG: STAS domain-containing protein [Acidimicrobiales bacterium]
MHQETTAAFFGANVTSDFAFEVTTTDDVHVVNLYGQLDLESSAQVRESLVAVAGSTVVVDLSGLRFLDSSGIAALLGARNEIIDAGHHFELRGARGIVLRVLEVTGLTSLLRD